MVPVLPTGMLLLHVDSPTIQEDTMLNVGASLTYAWLVPLALLTYYSTVNLLQYGWRIQLFLLERSECMPLATRFLKAKEFFTFFAFRLRRHH